MGKLFEVVLADGSKMKGNFYPAKDAKANLVFITGMQEYSSRYASMANWMNNKSVNVWVLDHFGQGENVSAVEEQQKWTVGTFDRTVDGLNEAIKLAKANGLPTVQAGHSMGSFMTQARLQKYPLAADKTLIIGSNGGQGFLMKMGYLLAKMSVHENNWDQPNPFLSNLGTGGYGKSIKDRKTDLDWLSYDEENVNKYILDPYCGHPNTGGFWREFLKGMAKLWDKDAMAKISPEEHILISSGAEDPVGQNGKGPKWLYEAYLKLGVKDVTLKLYEHMRHEIHNEKDHEMVYQDWLDFILK